MTVVIENLQNIVDVNDNIYNILNKAVEICLNKECFEIDSEISILLVDNEKIQEMNREHRNIDKPTDVLSFPMVDMLNGKILSNTGDYDIEENLLLLGDIVISIEKAIEQAEEYGHSFERELTFLVTHGVFHLLGYDHQNDQEEKVMLNKQEEVLEQMSLMRR